MKKEKVVRFPEQLKFKELIDNNGYRAKWVASKVPISEVNFNLMINGNIRMSERVQNRVIEIVHIY